MSCPPAAFVDVEFLKSVDEVLKPTGIVIVTRCVDGSYYIYKHLDVHNSASRYLLAAMKGKLVTMRLRRRGILKIYF